MSVFGGFHALFDSCYASGGQELGAWLREKGAELGWGCPAPGLGCRRQPHREPCGWARLEPAAPVGSRHGVAGSWVPVPLLLPPAAPEEWFIFAGKSEL